MKKVIIENATIEVVLQDDNELSNNNCPSGVISLKGDKTVRFEEAVQESHSGKRNPKLHSGKYLSLTRKKNGKYSFNMKTLEFDPELDVKEFARGVQKEIITAFNFIKA